MDQDRAQRTFDLTGCEVTRLVFDYSDGILIADGSDEVSILIETRILFHHDGIESEIDPQVDALSMAPLLNLLHKPTKSITFSSSGNLRLEMMDGAVVSVFKDEIYDSWEANGTGQFAEIAMLCTPHDAPPWQV